MARYPGGRSTNVYGNLTVTVESRKGYYVAHVHRPIDGYEVMIETPEQTRIGAARYALQLLADARRGYGQPDEALRRAAEEVGEDATEALAEIELSGHKMGNPPEDSIMDWVNNEEGLYNDVQALYQTWTEEGDDWDERTARREARELAAHFAEAIESMPHVQGKYTERDFQEAVDQMMEEFETYREGVIEAATERKRAPKAPEPMTPGQAEWAATCEANARRIGIEFLKTLVPASPERVRKALEEGDTDLRFIALRKWDQAALQIPRDKAQGLSLSEKVCALAHVAKWHYV